MRTTAVPYQCGQAMKTGLNTLYFMQENKGRFRTVLLAGVQRPHKTAIHSRRSGTLTLHRKNEWLLKRTIRKSKGKNTSHGFARARTVRMFHAAAAFPATCHKGNDAGMKAISRLVCMEAQESLRFDRKSWMLLTRKSRSILSAKRERRKRNRMVAGSVPPMRK